MPKKPIEYDVIIIGAGAAGLMCAIESGKRGRKTLVLDHSKKIAEKIRISGGGRCNFTNIHTSPDHFLSNNPHFCKSALKQYTQHDFIALVEKNKISYHEKTLGQLFCDESSQQIIDMLLDECYAANSKVQMETEVSSIEYNNGKYQIKTDDSILNSESVVIATGGLSIPKIGATKFGYTIAKQFGLNVIETFPALVPFTFQTDILERCKNLSGLSVSATVSCGKKSFAEGLLFTHRGLSGPSILQISSYWKEGDSITVNLCPDLDIDEFLKEKKNTQPKKSIDNILSLAIPNRLAETICNEHNIKGKIAECSDKNINRLAEAVNRWSIKPAGTEGYRTAEVTIRGVDTNELSSQTMECKKQAGLYFIGEVVDVTGHLGGFNFQWAWSSGYVAGQHA